MSNQFSDKLAPLAQRMGVPVPGTTLAPVPASDPTAISRAALDAVRNPLDPATALAPALAQAIPAPVPAAPTLALDPAAALDLDDVPAMDESDFTADGSTLLYDGDAPADEGADEEFGDPIDSDTAPGADDEPDYSDLGLTAQQGREFDSLAEQHDSALFGLGNDTLIETAARDGEAISLSDESISVAFERVQEILDRAPPRRETVAPADTDEVAGPGPTLADVIAAQEKQQANAAAAAFEDVAAAAAAAAAPRTDPIQHTEIDPEFITEEMALKMAAELRARNDAALRAALLSILPQIYGAKTLTAENDVAIYITENAAFRDWLSAIFKKLGVTLTHSDRSIDLGDGRIFLSRAPTMFDYRNSMMHLMTALDQVIEKAVALDQQSNGFNQLQARLIETQQQLTTALREKDLATNTATRLTAEAERIVPMNAFRIHWTAKGKKANGDPISKPCYLVVNIPEDPAKHKPDGTYVLNAYDVSFNPDDAHSFDSLETAQRTLELLRNYGGRIAQARRSSWFLPVHLASLHVVQWAHLVLANPTKTTRTI